MKQKNRGSITLEACIVVPIFMFLCLYMDSFFFMFEARHELAHVLLATTNSLAIESYELKSDDTKSSIGDLLRAGDVGFFGKGSDSSKGFSSAADWQDTPQNKEEINKTPDNSDVGIRKDKLMPEIKKRFIAYLSGGDKGRADEILANLGIKGGIDSIDFSESKVENGNLTVVIKYKIEYRMNPWAFPAKEMSNSATSKLW